MRITQLQIKNFRCFESLNLTLDAPLILIEGLNGAGKTSLLEAMHFLCYLRSFRTHMPQELVQFGRDHFFIKAHLQDTATCDIYDLQVGFTNKKRLVKINNKTVGLFKELLHYYRAVTLTEDDLGLIKEGPDSRRLFIDQCILLINPDFAALMKKSRDIVLNRNALLKKGGSTDSYDVWTEQLWHVSSLVQTFRIEMLFQLEKEIQLLIADYFDSEFTITLSYLPKKSLLNSIDEFRTSHNYLYQEEQRFGRSLFGSQLDDFSIQFKNITSKNFASRGQQKLIILLLKVAQIKLLQAQHKSVVFLLDDFMTDFDQRRIKTLILLLTEIKIQLILTVPTWDSPLQNELKASKTTFSKLTI